jgi:hypothetical protein
LENSGERSTAGEEVRKEAILATASCARGLSRLGSRLSGELQEAKAETLAVREE